MPKSKIKQIEVEGMVFGKWTLIAWSESHTYVYKGKPRYLPIVIAKCVCGREAKVRMDNLRKGRSSACSNCAAFDREKKIKEQRQFRQLNKNDGNNSRQAQQD